MTNRSKYTLSARSLGLLCFKGVSTKWSIEGRKAYLVFEHKRGLRVLVEGLTEKEGSNSMSLRQSCCNDTHPWSGVPGRAE